MAEPERLTLSGDTYVAYDFDVFPIDASFHPVAAVYVVTRRTGRGGADEHKLIYVGETESLPADFTNHPRSACFREHGADSVAVFRQADSTARQETVKDLLGQFKPVCNS